MRFLLSLLAFHLYNWNQHFFQGYAAVLEGVAEIISEVVVVVGITEVAIVFCEDETRIEIWFRQPDIMRFSKCEHSFAIIIKIASVLISNVRCRLLIANNLASRLYLHTTMICGDNEFDIFIRHFFQCLE